MSPCLISLVNSSSELKTCIILYSTGEDPWNIPRGHTISRTWLEAISINSPFSSERLMMPQDSQVEVSQSPGASDIVPNTWIWTADTGWEEEQTGDVRRYRCFPGWQKELGRA